MAELIEVGVWFEARPITVEQGVDRFEALRRGDAGWAAADPGIERFHREVLAGIDAAWWAGPVVAADTHVLLSLQPDTPGALLHLVHKLADDCELLCFQRPGRHQPAALWQPRRLLSVPVPRLATEDGSLAHHPTGEDIRDFLGRLDAANPSAVLWRVDGSSIRVSFVPEQRRWRVETVVGDERDESVQDDLAGVAERFEAFAHS
ncbi:hypothetical protein Daura_40365 [Dactylosporangium aurantiacum]|uniref:Uncharacterized protein n=1 Tax=Dactylosporangium aurantiacum TaxID=35754 RepID=A0A9Q9IAE1_9ACTN|nr:hypothetical protein [Dactylosporangium aurantiacum]MDG6102964.1 hypothetical protein [Dactylosporangium aurantiacum]UWZ52814.1 hypothetical protein Daura_40365 [Dactylosporangium aurantiacum]